MGILFPVEHSNYYCGTGISGLRIRAGLAGVGFPKGAGPKPTQATPERSANRK
jgi:hypothetical protein